jgi:glycosyltransferase A (GT-A) superfamily protein (DUF2064 family)
VDTVGRAAPGARVLAVDGAYPAPPGWQAVSQRGGPLGERLALAFADTRVPGSATLLIGMDTPQLAAGDLDAALRQLADPGGPGAVLGLAADGGWWALGLREPAHATVLRDIVTSTATTGTETLAALRGRGLRVGLLSRLRDVDTAADAHAVAAECAPAHRFPRAVAANVPRRETA